MPEMREWTTDAGGRIVAQSIHEARRIAEQYGMGKIVGKGRPVKAEHARTTYNSRHTGKSQRWDE